MPIRCGPHPARFPELSLSFLLRADRRGSFCLVRPGELAAPARLPQSVLALQSAPARETRSALSRQRACLPSCGGLGSPHHCPAELPLPALRGPEHPISSDSLPPHLRDPKPGPSHSPRRLSLASCRGRWPPVRSNPCSTAEYRR